MKSTASSIESLEARIAPASVLVFTDVDGDEVTMKSSAGNIAAPGVAVFVNAGLGQQLAALTLSDPNASFAGANLSTSVKRGPEGDGHVNIGFIDATGVDLGTVEIKGDLAQLTAGDAITATGFGVKALKVRTLGHYGTTTGGSVGSGGSLEIRVIGALGSLNVAGDVDGTLVIASGVMGGNDDNARIDSVKVGGSLIGGRSSGSGSIVATGGIATATIAHDIRGGAGAESGALESNGHAMVKSFTIGGSVVGGSGLGSGTVFFSNGASSVSVKGSVIGGTGAGSGEVLDDGGSAVEGSVKIGGSVIGGSGGESGRLRLGTAKSVSIGGDLIGGSITGSQSLASTGYIFGGDIHSLTIGGSVISGVDASMGTLSQSGAISVAHHLDKLTIKGNVIGNVGDGTAANLSPVFITASGNPAPTGLSTNVVFGRISIGGSVTQGRILAGYSAAAQPIPVDGNAQIGAVSIGGDWVASDLVAGVRSEANANPPDDSFGDTTDQAIPGFSGDAVLSRIASISIRGAVFGSANQLDHFGFVAQQIGSFQAGGYSAKLTIGQDVFPIRLTTGDVTIREVA